jgi:hypothetical protein
LIDGGRDVDDLRVGNGNEDASCVPDLSTLFATRGNRWLTVAYTARGVPGRGARDRAAAFAILGFRLTAP